MSHGCSGHARMLFSDSEKPVESLFLVGRWWGSPKRPKRTNGLAQESLRGISTRSAPGHPAAWLTCDLPGGRVVPWLFAPNGSNWTMCDDFALIGFTVVRT